MNDDTFFERLRKRLTQRPSAQDCPLLPNAPYVAVRWREICDEGESLTKNQRAPYWLAHYAVGRRMDRALLRELAKSTKDN